MEKVAERSQPMRSSDVSDILSDYFIQVQILKEQEWKNYDFFDKGRSRFSLEERLSHVKRWLKEPRQQQDLKEYRIILMYAGFEFVSKRDDDSLKITNSNFDHLDFSEIECMTCNEKLAGQGNLSQLVIELNVKGKPYSFNSLCCWFHFTKRKRATSIN